MARCNCGQPAQVLFRLTVTALDDAVKQAISHVRPSELALCLDCALSASKFVKRMERFREGLERSAREAVESKQ
jgi:hypothetical protein